MWTGFRRVLCPIPHSCATPQGEEHSKPKAYLLHLLHRHDPSGCLRVVPQRESGSNFRQFMLDQPDSTRSCAYSLEQHLRDSITQTNRQHNSSHTRCLRASYCHGGGHSPFGRSIQHHQHDRSRSHPVCRGPAHSIPKTSKEIPHKKIRICMKQAAWFTITQPSGTIICRQASPVGHTYDQQGTFNPNRPLEKCVLIQHFIISPLRGHLQLAHKNHPYS